MKKPPPKKSGEAAIKAGVQKAREFQTASENERNFKNNSSVNGSSFSSEISQTQLAKTSKNKGGRPRKDPTKRLPFSFSDSLGATINANGGGNMSFLAAKVFEEYFLRLEADATSFKVQIPFTSGKVAKSTFYFYLPISLAEKINAHSGNRSALGEGIFRNYFAEKDIQVEEK